MKNFRLMTVGEIVSEDYKYAKVFERYKINYSCNGSIPLSEACRYASAGMDEMIDALKEVALGMSTASDFKSWTTGRLINYILKFHHGGIRKEGPMIESLLEAICERHADSHPELFEVRELFAHLLANVYDHLRKEEADLFPYIRQLCEERQQNTPIPAFHCESIQTFIAVMMSEHDTEGERYHHIALLTHNYAIPPDSCASYKMALEMMRNFEISLHHHIHLENNIVFPRVIRMEKARRKR